MTLEPRSSSTSGLMSGEDPLEPRLPDPLLGFVPPGLSVSLPAVMLFRATVPSCAWPTPFPREWRRLRFKVCSATRSAFLSRDSVPSWILWPLSLLRLFGRSANPGLWILLGRSLSTGEASGVFERTCVRPEFDREEMSVLRTWASSQSHSIRISESARLVQAWNSISFIMAAGGCRVALIEFLFFFIPQDFEATKHVHPKNNSCCIVENSCCPSRLCETVPACHHESYVDRMRN